MPFCKQCGQGIPQKTQIVQTKNIKKERAYWAYIGLITGILGGYADLIITSIIGLCVYKANTTYKTICWIGLIFSIFWIIIFIIIRSNSIY